MNSTTDDRSGRRLGEVDALRGLAAMAVVLFHYTTRYGELFGHAHPTAFSVPFGHYGVNLFFMISGFVIFMTLSRTQRPLDFVVSRLSRLYPAYWVAVGSTFLVVSALGLPGKEVRPTAAAANLLMFHGFFGVPSVDAVYWTLEVELIFYAWALLAFRLDALGRVHTLLLLLFGARLAHWGLASFAGIDLPWTLYKFLLLGYIPWFGCGIAIYRIVLDPDRRRLDGLVLAAAVLLLLVVDGVQAALLAIFFSALLWAAASGRLSLLTTPALLWLGSISYTLYLLHENIGWAVMRQLQQHGWSGNASALFALVVALALAQALTMLVEKPAMAWIRARYKAWRAPDPGRAE